MKKPSSDIYIDEYVRQKSLGKSSAQSILSAFDFLENDRKNTVKKLHAINRNHKISSTRKKDEHILAEIKEALNQLKSNEVRLVEEIVANRINEISKAGYLKKLLQYFLKDVAANDIQLHAILKNKKLDSKTFSKKPTTTLTLSSELSEHAKWAFENIYRFAYPKDATFPLAKKANISRYFHGIQHVSRVAMYIPVFANLYRKHGDEEAKKLTDQDIKLLQIAALFHDSAREDENEDQWDHESALFLYHYLTRILNVDKSKAKLIAEATANKDPSDKKGCFEITESANGVVSWRFNPVSTAKKNIYQKLIHDADCLDIIRARPSFDAKYLDFYKDIAVDPKNKVAFSEMAHLIMEARSLIAIQGDTYKQTKPIIKKKYEHADGFNAVRSDIDKEKHAIINALKDKLLTEQELKNTPLVDLTSFDSNQGLTEANLRAALRDGKLFARAIATPSAYAKKHPNETYTQLELRKTMRALDVPTRSNKTADDAHKKKEGNPLRSVTMLGYGANVFASAGFLILDSNINAIKQIHHYDSGTGRGKKEKIATDANTNQSELASFHQITSCYAVDGSKQVNARKSNCLADST